MNLSDNECGVSSFEYQPKTRVYSVLAVHESLLLVGTESRTIWVHELNEEVPVDVYNITMEDSASDTAVLCLYHLRE